MRKRQFLSSAFIAISLVVTGCASTGGPGSPAFTESIAQEAGLSRAAAATAVYDSSGALMSYEAPEDALKAGDTFGYLKKLKALGKDEVANDQILSAYLAIDRAAAGDLDAARRELGFGAEGDDPEVTSDFYVFLNAWFYALEGKPEMAIQQHRNVASGMPGLTGDLSLAALLEAIGRPEQAIAVYESITPARIEAPEHQFDPRGLVYSHVRTVVARHALLLRQLGRIEEAKAVYQQLADAEPEEAISYAAAIESLETGKNLEDEAIDVEGAFAQSLSDVSRAVQEQRILRLIMMGIYPDGFDPRRSAFDQVALLIDPSDEGLRGGIVADLYDNGFYEGAAHVALGEPEPSAAFQISAGHAYIMAEKPAAAEAAIAESLTLMTEDEELDTLYGAVRLRTLLEDKKGAYELLQKVMVLAENPAEQASAHAVSADIYSQFGDVDIALEHAKQARALDDTHDRRILLADALGDAGQIEEGLAILRSEILVRPNDPYMLNSLGYYLAINTDMYEEGYKVLARARALAQRDPYIADSLGWAMFKLGHLERALRLIESAQADLEPQQHWEVETHLGDIYWHLGKKDEAIAAWKIALENWPPVDKKKEIEARLVNGLTEPKPEKRKLPDVSLDDGEIARQDI
ncbi:MAG: tetratricopeptide repeat protein [Hyphomonas sp.]